MQGKEGHVAHMGGGGPLSLKPPRSLPPPKSRPPAALRMASWAASLWISEMVLGPSTWRLSTQPLCRRSITSCTGCLTQHAAEAPVDICIKEQHGSLTAAPIEQ